MSGVAVSRCRHCGATTRELLILAVVAKVDADESPVYCHAAPEHEHDFSTEAA